MRLFTPVPRRSILRSWTSPLRSSQKFPGRDGTFRAISNTPLVLLVTMGPHSWLTVVATLASFERSLCAPSGLLALLRTGDGARGQGPRGGAREPVRRGSAGARGAEHTPGGGGGGGRRGGIPGHHDGGVAPRIGKRVGANTSRGWTLDLTRAAMSLLRACALPGGGSAPPSVMHLLTWKACSVY